MGIPQRNLGSHHRKKRNLTQPKGQVNINVSKKVVSNQVDEDDDFSSVDLSARDAVENSSKGSSSSDTFTPKDKKRMTQK